MNGPQHYARAQQLDAEAGRLVGVAQDDTRKIPETVAALLAAAQVAATRAQVHATLAGVALTLQAYGAPNEAEDAAWQEAMR